MHIDTQCQGRISNIKVMTYIKKRKKRTIPWLWIYLIQSVTLDLSSVDYLIHSQELNSMLAMATCFWLYKSLNKITENWMTNWTNNICKQFLFSCMVCLQILVILSNIQYTNWKVKCPALRYNCHYGDRVGLWFQQLFSSGWTPVGLNLQPSNEQTRFPSMCLPPPSMH